MRVQPHLPSRPLTATVMDNSGFFWCACRAANSPAPPEPSMRMSVLIVFIRNKKPATEAQKSQRKKPEQVDVFILCFPLCPLCLCGKALSFNPQSSEDGSTLVARGIVDLRIQVAAVAVHRDEQRAEALDAEFPQRLGIEIVEIDVFDLLDPRRLERRGAADDREIDAAVLRERGERAFAHPALADDD